jgi:hypothetical protein
MAQAIDLLTTAAASPANLPWLAIQTRTERSVELRARLRAYDGDTETFNLEISALDADMVRVQEQPLSRRLPCACPERHINSDGSFCLGPEHARIDTVASAEKWWAELAGYLELQLRADETGSWSREYAWPHGDAAAAQERLEAARRGLPASVATTRVRRDGLLVGRRLRCPCGKKRQLRRCHEKAILSLMALEAQVAREEAAFWKTWSRPCCRTMASCPLNRPNS